MIAGLSSSRTRDPVVVVGAGIAGLATALSVTSRPVILLTHGALSSSGATPKAQGGIAAAWLPSDSPGQHAIDTVVAGSGYNNGEAVQLLTEQARDAIDWLTTRGVRFDCTEQGPLLCLEGGHSWHRILHAGGDVTGRVIVDALSQRVRSESNITVVEQVDVDSVLLSGDRVGGVQFADAGGRRETVESGAVVLATGGVGALFQWTSNPPECDGAGLAIGMAAGATCRDLELMQFHPTMLAPADGSNATALMLVSEAVRGAGAILVDEQGRRLMLGVHALMDLAPRDVVARRVWRAGSEGRAVFLDARCIGSAWPGRFPSIFSACMAHGLDPRDSPIPVVPGAHFHMGGLRTDLDGRTSVAGLFAVGEVACNGVHGANRLASNSLLEGIVFGRRLGNHLSRQPPEKKPSTVRPKLLQTRGIDPTILPHLRAGLSSALGPERTLHGVSRCIAMIQADEALRGCRQGRVALAMLHSALERPRSLGAHHWATPESMDAEQAVLQT